MRRCVVWLAGLSIVLPVAANPLDPKVRSLARLPVVFEENRGQIEAEARFLARGMKYSLALGQSQAAIGLATANGEVEHLGIEWLGGNRRAPVQGVAETGGRSNYLKGEEMGGWTTGVRHYSRVRYEGVYPGIDLFFYGNAQDLEFDFVLAPGADPSKIKLRTNGVRHVQLSRNGDLILKTAHGELRLSKPHLYQPTTAGPREVEGSFQIGPDEIISFRTGRYDKAQPLVIDPTLITSYLGGRDVDIVSAVASDSTGAVYITGYTASSNFPVTASPYKNTLAAGDSDAFVVKLNPAMTSVVYATYLGGNFPDFGRAIAVDAAGAAYITGSTIGRFPTTTGAFRTSPANTPAIFIAKLDAAGANLVYSTYLDGAGAGHGIAVDSAQNAYVAGFTYTAGFTTTAGAFQRLYGGATDAFLVKMNPGGTAQLYSTFLGGSGEDQATAIDIDSEGSAYVAGFTSSADYPVTGGAVRTAFSGSTDAFVTKVNASGSGLTYSTFLGGSDVDRAHAIDVNAANEAFVAGQTFSSSFPTTAGAFHTTHGGGGADAFVTKLNSAGSGLVYSTFLGGGGICEVTDPFHIYQCDGAFAISVDSSNRAYVAGLAGLGFPLAAAVQTTAGGNGDAFVSQLNANGTALLFSTYLGGGAGDVALAMANSTVSGPVVAGFTNSTDLPVNGLQTTRGGGTQEGFVSHLAPCSITAPLGASSFFPIQQATYVLGVAAPSNCAWSATSDQSWVTINSGTGTGAGTVSYTVAGNAGAFRTATISINGQASLLVQQLSGLCISLSYTDSWFPANAGTWYVSVYASCAWTATSNQSWMTIVFGASGNGDLPVFFDLAANTSSSPRVGQLAIGGSTVTVRQLGSGPPSLGCSYALSKSSDAMGKDGGSSSVVVTALAGCEWSIVNTESWITVTAGVAGQGEGLVGYTVRLNTTGQTRTGTLMIGGQALVITQSGNN